MIQRGGGSQFPETLARAADSVPLPEMLTQKAAFLGMRTALPESTKEHFFCCHCPGADSQRVFPVPLAQAFMLVKGSLCLSPQVRTWSQDTPGSVECGVPLLSEPPGTGGQIWLRSKVFRLFCLLDK